MLWGTSVYKTAATLFLLFFLFSTTEIAAQKADSASAWIKVIAELEQYYIVVDQDFEHPYLINRGDSIQVDPGNRHITVVWETINDYSFTFNAKARETFYRRIYHSFPSYPRSSYQTIVSQTNLFITTDENSTVYINGERAGKHMVQALLNPGTHQLNIEHPEHGTLRKKVEVNSINVTEVARFNENPSGLSFAAKLLPGAEYLASKRYVRAAITYVGLGLLTAKLVRHDRAYSKRHNEYNEWDALYQTAQTSEDAISYRRNALRARGDLEDISTDFNQTLLITAGVYLISTLDAFCKPRSGYRGKTGFSQNAMIRASTGTVNNRAYPTLTFKYHIR